jgi:hypothetical protein
MSFADDIERVAGSEPIEAIVIGRDEWGSAEDHLKRSAVVRIGVVLTWGEARPMLEYDYNAGYGLPECDAIWAWTPSRVLFVSQYDGATVVEWVPRNPVDGMPDMPGGS